MELPSTTNLPVRAGTISGANDDLDLELVRQVSQGDLGAFERIMRRYNQRLFRLAYGILGDASDAEDALQESYVRAFYALSKYEARGSLGAWLAQIVRHEGIDRRRARTVQRKYIALENELSSEGEPFLESQAAPRDDVRSDPQSAAENAEMKHVIEEAVAELPEAFRAVFMLREVEGLSIEETADYLAIPAATVRTRDHRARAYLRRRLGAQIDRTIPSTFPFLSTRCDRLVTGVLGRLTQ